MLRLRPNRTGGRDAVSPGAFEQASRVRAKLARGTLRGDACTGGTVVALGSLLACRGCDETIPLDQVELRARFVDGSLLRFHARCFATWQSERTE